MTKFTVINHAYEATRTEDSYSEAEERIDSALVEFSDLEEDDLEIVEGEYDEYEAACDAAGASQPDGGNTEVVEEPDADPVPAEQAAETESALAKLGQSITKDPLDVLPSYMITRVDEEPTLNKRGVSVLAFHYDVSVVGFEVIAHPHETDYEYCAMRFTVEREGKEYVGHGEAHADDVDKSKLLRMAETRAYKRAVIFATGTGIVGYQEVRAELQS